MLYVAPKDSDARDTALTFMRYMFDRERIMRLLVETVFGFCGDSQGMVDIRIDNGRLFFNTSGIKKLIEDLFGTRILLY